MQYIEIQVLENELKKELFDLLVIDSVNYYRYTKIINAPQRNNTKLKCLRSCAGMYIL